MVLAALAISLDPHTRSGLRKYVEAKLRPARWRDTWSGVGLITVGVERRLSFKYVPVQDIVQAIFVDEFQRAGVEGAAFALGLD